MEFLKMLSGAEEIYKHIYQKDIISLSEVSREVRCCIIHYSKIYKIIKSDKYIMTKIYLMSVEGYAFSNDEFIKCWKIMDTPDMHIFKQEYDTEYDCELHFSDCIYELYGMFIDNYLYKCTKDKLQSVLDSGILSVECGTIFNEPYDLLFQEIVVESLNLGSNTFVGIYESYIFYEKLLHYSNSPQPIYLEGLYVYNDTAREYVSSLSETMKFKLFLETIESNLWSYKDVTNMICDQDQEQCRYHILKYICLNNMDVNREDLEYFINLGNYNICDIYFKRLELFDGLITEKEYLDYIEENY